MDNEIHIDLVSQGGVTYIALTIDGDEDSIAFTIPQTIELVETLNKGIQQALAAQKIAVN